MNIQIRPEKQERTIWFLVLALFSVPVLVAFVILSLTVNVIAFGICTIGWILTIFVFVLWLPAYFKSLEYTIDDESVREKHGVFWRKHITVPYKKITNVDVTQGPVQRMYNIGTINLQTAGAGGQQAAKAELRIVGVKEFNELREAIMERVLGHPDTNQAKPSPAPIPAEKDTLSHISREVTAIRKLLERHKE